jgi:SAM-dependent methyltransferase
MTDSAGPGPFDRQLLQQRKARALKAGPEYFLLEHANRDLAERLAMVNRRFDRSVVLGGYGGALAGMLEQDTQCGRVIRTDACPALLQRQGGPCIAVDEEYLPFAPASLDLVVSPLALHWANDLPGALVQIRRALRPDSLFLAAMVGGGTLDELRRSFMQAELDISGGASARVAPFARLADMAGLVGRAGFILPVIDREVLNVRYDSPMRLLADLRAMGATSPLEKRPRQALRRDVLLRLLEIYTRSHSDADGRIRATFEIFYLTGWTAA